MKFGRYIKLIIVNPKIEEKRNTKKRKNDPMFPWSRGVWTSKKKLPNDLLVNGCLDLDNF